MPNDVEELTGWSLSCAVAERLGWRELRCGCGTWFGTHPSCYSSFHRDEVPAYHASFDACEWDLLPVLKAAGWHGWSVETASDHHGYDASIYGNPEREMLVAEGATVAEAISRAFLVATAPAPRP